MSRLLRTRRRRETFATIQTSHRLPGPSLIGSLLACRSPRVDLFLEKARELFAKGKTHTCSSTTAYEYVGHRSFDGTFYTFSQKQRDSPDSGIQTQVFSGPAWEHAFSHVHSECCLLFSLRSKQRLLTHRER